MSKKTIRTVLIPAITLIAAFGLGGGVYAAISSGDEAAESTAPITAEARERAPASQQPSLADGAVTEAEYAAALAATAACAQDGGVAASVVPGRGKAPPSLTFAAPTLAEAEAQRAVVAACQALHLNDVQAAFNASRRPTSSQLEAGRELFGECMRAAGVAPEPGTPSEEQLVAWLRTADHSVSGFAHLCLQQHYETLGFWP